MVSELKRKVFQALQEADLNITDNRNYEEQFPWCMLRTGNIQRIKYRDVRTEIVTLTIDIFSKYSGEEEILLLQDKISGIIEEMEWDCLMGAALSSCLIMDDKSTGPVRKHGILNYQFVLNEGWEMVEDDEP